MSIDHAIKQATVLREIKKNNNDCKVDQVILEKIITLKIKDGEDFQLLCSPLDLEALTIGFLFAQNLIRAYDDIQDISVVEDTIIVRLRNNVCKVFQHFISHNIPSLCQSIPAAVHEPIFSSIKNEDLMLMITQLHVRQRLFKLTGASHAALIFSHDLQILAFAEDVGRHNAFDKAIGMMLQAKHPLIGCGVALSSRVSFEMITKAARAGLEIVAAVSAPTSLAIDIANHCGITLCGFVRNNCANIYSHPARIEIEK